MTGYAVRGTAPRGNPPSAGHDDPCPLGTGFIGDYFGLAINDIDPATTAYPHRSQNFSITSVGLGSREDVFLGHWDDLRPHLDGLYLSFETDQRPERLHDAFPGDTLTKLRRLKGQYDPDNSFNQNFPTSPAPRDELVEEGAVRLS